MYRTPIDDVTFSDIQAFVSQENRETIILDYKEDWPKDLEKVIAAMANTQGGVILLGVTEQNKTGRPQEAIGVDLGPGADHLRQRVVSKSYEAIYPPVMPEVAVCPLDQDLSRAVVLIRVAPSDRTPHAVDQRRRIYVRVDSITEPHSLATLHELEWLWERRRKAEEGRTVLIEAAKERAAWILQRTEEEPEAILRAWVAPYFHSGEEAVSLDTVRGLLRTHREASDVKGGLWSFPGSVDSRRSVPMGYCAYANRPNRSEYDELGASGLVFTELRLCEVDAQTGWQQLHPYRVLSQIDGLLKFASYAYGEGRMWGLVQVHASLHNVQGAALPYVLKPHQIDEPSTHRSASKVIRIIDETVNSHELEEARPTLVRQGARTMLWAFGFGWNEERFDQWYQQEIRA